MVLEFPSAGHVTLTLNVIVLSSRFMRVCICTSSASLLQFAPLAFFVFVCVAKLLSVFFFLFHRPSLSLQERSVETPSYFSLHLRLIKLFFLSLLTRRDRNCWTEQAGSLTYRFSYDFLWCRLRNQVIKTRGMSSLLRFPFAFAINSSPPPQLRKTVNAWIPAIWS